MPQQQKSVVSIRKKISLTASCVWPLYRLSRWNASAATNTCCGGKHDRLCLHWNRCGAASDSQSAQPFHSRSGDASPVPCPKSSGSCMARWGGMNTNRILVTGTSGFIGRPLVAALFDAGYAGRVQDHLWMRWRAIIRPLFPGRACVREPSRLSAACVARPRSVRWQAVVRLKRALTKLQPALARASLASRVANLLTNRGRIRPFDGASISGLLARFHVLDAKR